jgi:hypothetical protein
VRRFTPVVNDMYSRFPDTDATLRRRLRSRNNAELRAALDELLVHDVLSRRFRVVLSSTSDRRPTATRERTATGS